MLRTLRRQAGRTIRRLGLLPGGIPDGLGEDEILGDYVIESGAVVFFPDTVENLYQIRQWYGALEQLDGEMGVTIVTQDSRTARAIRSEIDLPVLIVALNRTYSALIRRSRARIAIYVGHSNNNAVGLRSTHVAHIFLAHGDSDKSVSVSNQVKGFDFAFVAGQAAVDRYTSSVLFLDAESHLRVVGRPQLPELSTREDDAATTVLYAPTWEGSQDVNAYSSVKSHGMAIVQSLAADPGLTIVYRPHPRTGASDKSFRDADIAIRAYIETLGERGRIDTSRDAGAAFGAADVLISDISAMCVDWLSQRRPLLITVPAEPEAVPTSPSRMVRVCPRITVEGAATTATLVRQATADESIPAVLEQMAQYYLDGKTGPDAMEAFVRECKNIARLRDEQATRTEGTDDE
ncbi:CDP-glycerol glycerophosphotransferase family protein [Demequina aurantiaca]|uniref:CDP-glycerol glycerophosphotransferase family protein n=1 Tax=Demequina aurantiaca TaxID=676200 RepID=UPI00078266B4|nr:CDP-glycerol glycerophosphotransferase family protein [Demequina aurantiaca]